MCHTIASRRDVLYISFNKQTLMGVKEFRIESGIVPSVVLGVYNVKKFPVISALVKEQPIYFELRSGCTDSHDRPRTGMTLLSTMRKAGIHIAPFDTSTWTGGAFRDIIEHQIDINVELPNHASFKAPVLFDNSDVLFFDGVDVSVKKLKIAKPEDLVDLIGKETIKLYKAFYNKLEEVANHQKGM